MKTIDFEKAIEALGFSIVLDEVRLHKGHVTRFYGHKGDTLLMWDETGQGFFTLLYTAKPEEITHETHTGVCESCYQRNEIYDLKFE